MTDTLDALNDPKLRGSYRQPRSEVEICGEKHYHHMNRVQQRTWLARLMQKADKMKAEQEIEAAKDLAVWRETKREPKKRKPRKRA